MEKASAYLLKIMNVNKAQTILGESYIQRL